MAVAAKPPQGIGRGQRLQVTAVQVGAPGEVLDIPEGARGGDPLGAGTGQALDHPEPQPQGGRGALQGAVPVTDTDIDRPHLDPVAPGILHELGGGIEAHGLAVQQRAGEGRGLVALEPGRAIGQEREARGMGLRKTVLAESADLLADPPGIGLGIAALSHPLDEPPLEVLYPPAAPPRRHRAA